MLPANMRNVKLPQSVHGHKWSIGPQTLLEIFFLAILIGLLVWVPPPDVNEAHYLVKAKHFWNRNWCPTDLFTNSHETHWLFYASFGWLTRLFSIEATAWIGRATAWIVVSWGMVNLIRCFEPRSWLSLLLAPLVVIANRCGHLAGEWFVGGVEAKAIAWGFVFATLAHWLRRDWRLSIFYASVACGFHVVIGLWSLILIMMASLAAHRFTSNDGPPDIEEGTRPSRQFRFRYWLLPALSIGFVATGLIPALQLNMDFSRDLIRTASELQAYSRLAHHQDAWQFDAARWWTFLAMLSSWIVLKWANGPNRNTALSKLDWAAIAALALNVVGIILSIAGHTYPSLRPFAASILVLYWFRMADVLVPLVVVLHGFVWMNRLGGANRIGIPRIIVVVTVGLSVFWNAWCHFAEPISGCARQSLAGGQYGTISGRDLEADRNWQRTCKWIAENTPADSTHITPANQQTFKWYAGRSEAANWKDMPQDAAGVVEWNERLTALYQEVSQAEFGMLGLYDHEILDLADRYDADYLIVETRFVDWRKSIGYMPAFRQVYPVKPEASQSTFSVFQLNNGRRDRVKQAEPVAQGEFP